MFFPLVANKKTFLLAVLLLLFAFALRAEFEHAFFPYQYDNGAQLEAARNYVRGQGLTECVVKPNDVSAVVCDKQTWWAIGVPVALSYIYQITGNLLQAEFLLRCLAFIVFFAAVFLIFNVLAEEVSPVAFYLFCLFYAFLYPQYGMTFTSDILSLAFFMAACACSFYLIFRTQTLSSTVLISVLCGLFLFLTGFMRYAYYPVIPIVPGAVLFVSLIKDRKRLLTSVLTIGASVLLFFELMQLIAPGHFAANSFVKEGVKGFFPEHLLYFDSFIFKSFVPWELFAPIVKSRGEFFNLAVNTVVALISFVLLFPLLSKGYENFRRLRSSEFKPTTYLNFLTLIALFWIVFFIGYLSVRTPKMFDEDTWIFAATTRYFLPFIVLFQISIFSYVSSLKIKGFSLKTVVAAFLFVAFSTHFAVWSAFHYKAHVKNDSRSEFAYRIKLQEKINQTIREISQTEGKPVFLIGNYGLELLDEDINVLSALEFYPSINELKAAAPTVLIVRLPKNLKQVEKEFFAAHNGQKLLDLEDSDLYRADILP